MTKKQIQKRISKESKTLALSKFTWSEKTRTFCSYEDNLLINFHDLEGCVITAGYSSTIKAGDSSTIDAGSYSTITAGYSSTITAGYSSTIKAGDSSTIDAGSYSTIKAGDSSTIDAGSYSTIKAGYSSTIKAGDSSTIKAGYSSTIKAGDSSTIKAGYSSTIKAGSSSTIDAKYSSTIHANGEQIVIINRNVLEIILPDENDVIQICPYQVEGHIKNGMYKGEPHILTDGILSKVIKQKGDVYHVINHGEAEKSHIVKKGEIYSHGKTLKEARESLLYKISDRDKSQFENITLDSVLTLEECIAMYRVITGACEAGTRYFVESLDKVKKKYSVQEIIDLTQGQYGNQELQKFIGV